jgi:hypothetical protein
VPAPWARRSSRPASRARDHRRRVLDRQLHRSGGTPNNYYGGGAFAALVRLNGNAFAFDAARHSTGSLTWSGMVSGTVAPGSVALSVRATGTFDGKACDSGPLSLTLTPIPIR